MKIPKDPNVLVGIERSDDAGVYKISDDLALIQTVDFFTPIVDDPFHFGQIAVANALSDVYAMGGIPKTAMNLVAFPIKEMGIDILRRVLEGGLDKMNEAGVVLLGGHSIEDKELKYGLSVTGFVKPDRIIQNTGLKPGDKLVLTKPLGTGIINTAIKGGVASAQITETITRIMAALNREASMVMQRYPVSACTDITGFGLLGHLAEMIVGTPVSIRLDTARIPVLPEAAEYARIGFIPGGALKNKAFRAPMVEFAARIDPVMQDILFDPQTSGGLVMGVRAELAQDLTAELKDSGVNDATVIGEVEETPPGRLMVD